MQLYMFQYGKIGIFTTGVYKSAPQRQARNSVPMCNIATLMSNTINFSHSRHTMTSSSMIPQRWIYVTGLMSVNNSVCEDGRVTPDLDAGQGVTTWQCVQDHGLPTNFTQLYHLTCRSSNEEVVASTINRNT